MCATSPAKSLSAIHGPQKTMQSYIWVTQGKRCFETRGLSGADQLQIASGDYQHPHRDLTHEHLPSLLPPSLYAGLHTRQRNADLARRLRLGQAFGWMSISIAVR